MKRRTRRNDDDASHLAKRLAVSVVLGEGSGYGKSATPTSPIVDLNDGDEEYDDDNADSTSVETVGSGAGCDGSSAAAITLGGNLSVDQNLVKVGISSGDGVRPDSPGRSRRKRATDGDDIGRGALDTSQVSEYAVAASLSVTPAPPPSPVGNNAGFISSNFGPNNPRRLNLRRKAHALPTTTITSSSSGGGGCSAMDSTTADAGYSGRITRARNSKYDTSSAHRLLGMELPSNLGASPVPRWNLNFTVPASVVGEHAVEDVQGREKPERLRIAWKQGSLTSSSTGGEYRDDRCVDSMNVDSSQSHVSSKTGCSSWSDTNRYYSRNASREPTPSGQSRDARRRKNRENEADDECSGYVADHDQPGPYGGPRLVGRESIHIEGHVGSRRGTNARGGARLQGRLSHQEFFNESTNCTDSETMEALNHAGTA